MRTFMPDAPYFLINLAISFLVFSLIFPSRKKELTEYFTVPVLLVCTAELIFGIESILLGLSKMYWSTLFTACFMPIGFIYLIATYKKVQYGHLTLRIDDTNDSLDRSFVNEGNSSGLAPAEPFTQRFGSNFDAPKNSMIDMRIDWISILKTEEYKTSDGWLAVLVRILLPLEVAHENAHWALHFIGGIPAMKENLRNVIIPEFFHDFVPGYSAEVIDGDKNKFHATLSRKLAKYLKDFFRKEKYPFRLTGRILIGDTQLPNEFYKARTAKNVAEGEQRAKNYETEQLGIRIDTLGEKLLPGHPKKDQTEIAMNAMGLVPRKTTKTEWDLSKNVTDTAKEAIKLIPKNSGKGKLEISLNRGASKKVTSLTDAINAAFGKGKK